MTLFLFELGKFLEKEQVIISLLQNFVPVSETAVNLKDFLYNTCHKSIGSNLVREVLITKCKNFPGSLSPKLEFISQTSIREVIAKPKTASIGKLINQHALAGGVQLPLTGKIKQRPQEIIRPRSASPNRAVSNQVKIPKMANNSRPKTGQHIRGRSMSPKKIIKLNKKESNHSNLDQLMVETSVREDENLPGYMKMTVASRSKSPNRKVKPRTRQARLVMTGNEYNSLTKTVKIKDSEAVNNVNRIKEINQHGGRWLDHHLF